MIRAQGQGVLVINIIAVVIVAIIIIEGMRLGIRLWIILDWGLCVAVNGNVDKWANKLEWQVLIINKMLYFNLHRCEGRTCNIWRNL